MARRARMSLTKIIHAGFADFINAATTRPSDELARLAIVVHVEALRRLVASLTAAIGRARRTVTFTRRRQVSVSARGVPSPAITAGRSPRRRLARVLCVAVTLKATTVD